MKIKNVTLNSYQTQVMKELMGDGYMTDGRAEAILARLASRYDVDLLAVAEAVNKNYAVKHEAFKKANNEQSS